MYVTFNLKVESQKSPRTFERAMSDLTITNKFGEDWMENVEEDWFWDSKIKIAFKVLYCNTITGKPQTLNSHISRKETHFYSSNISKNKLYKFNVTCHRYTLQL